MSIICYTGLPGDGKSYSAVENVIIPALKEGRHVAHNLILNVAALTVVCGRPVEQLLHQIDKDDTPAQLIEKCPPGAVVVIDEVWRYWPAGVKANEVPKDELKFFKEHRHRVGEDGLASEILIIDQDPRTGVPAFLRALIELTYVHTKQSAVGAKGKFRVDVYTRAQSAEKPSKSAQIRKLMGSYKPEVWNCYVSHTQSKRPGEAGLEKAVDDRASVLKSWTVRAAVVAAVGLPFAFWWAAAAMQDLSGAERHVAPDREAQRAAVRAQRSEHAPRAGAAEVPVASGPGPRQSQQRGAPPRKPNPETDVSMTWRVLGVIHKANGTGQALIASATGRRFLDVSRCAQDLDSNWRCKVEDGLATMWSGSSLSPLSAKAPEGIRQDHGGTAKGS